LLRRVGRLAPVAGRGAVGARSRIIVTRADLGPSLRCPRKVPLTYSSLLCRPNTFNSIMATVEPSPAFSPCQAPGHGVVDKFNLADNAKISKEMHLGVNQGDTKAVMKALEEGEVPEAQTQFGEHALHRGVRSGVLEVVDALLDAGASVDSRDASGKTPLITVCGMKASNYCMGHHKIMERLLERGADPLAADNKGHTALGRACAAGHTHIVLTLLKAGVPSDDPDEDGMTPLLHACKGKHVSIVEVLLKEDRLAKFRKHPVSNVNAKQASTGKTALMFAAASKRVQMVSLLLAHKADPFVECDKGKTALKYCRKAPDCADKLEAAASKASGKFR